MEKIVRIPHIKRGFIFFFIVAGILRLVWPGDMEWKSDELAMYEMAAKHAQEGTLPAFGMASGVGIPNAGFSVWPFILFYAISSDPVHMVQCVMVLNILAILLMFKCASSLKVDKIALQMGVIIMSVNVLSVIFSRKLWAQDLIPVFVSIIWYFSLIKNKKLGLWLIALVAMLCGQLHISGYFLGFGLFASEMILNGINWKKLLIILSGAATGLIPALPWFWEVLNSNSSSGIYFYNVYKLEFFLHAVTDPLGFNVVYSLGTQGFKKFLAEPVIGNIPTFLVLVISVTIVIITLLSIKKIQFKGLNITKKTIQNRPLYGYILSFVLIPGVLLTLSGSPIRSHYLIISSPFLHAVFANLWLKRGEKTVWFVVLLQSIISVIFLFYIHKGGITADYGIPYRLQ